jgi:hypothetical protein
MKKTDECPNCGYVFTAEDEEPDYISEIGGAYETEAPLKKTGGICPVCGEKRGHKTVTKKKTGEAED